jgi:hypothetical protein
MTDLPLLFLGPPKMRKLKDPGGLWIPGADAHMGIGTIKEWSRQGVMEDTETGLGKH